MAKLRWTPQAADDLEAIAEYIASDSSHYAQLFVLKAVSLVEKLELFPQMGRIVPEKGDPTIREILFGNYRIVYRIRGEIVELLTIYHSARLLDLSQLK